MINSVKNINKFFYCFKKTYNFKMGVIKRGKEIWKNDQIFTAFYPNFFFKTLYHRMYIGLDFNIGNMSFIDFMNRELVAIKDRELNWKLYLR